MIKGEKSLKFNFIFYYGQPRIPHEPGEGGIGGLPCGVLPRASFLGGENAGTLGEALQSVDLDTGETLDWGKGVDLHTQPQCRRL